MDRLVLGPELLKEMELIVKQVQGILKIGQDRQKSQADLKWTPKEFQVGEHVFIKVRPKKSAKLAPRYCGPFKILFRIGQVAYQLALPPILRVHNVFYISVIKKYVHDATHVINWNDVQVEPEGDFFVEPNCILKWRESLASKLHHWLGEGAMEAP